VNLSQNEFACYLLLHASYADLKIHNKEFKLLVKKFGQNTVDQLQDLYSDQTDFQKKLFIKKQAAKYLNGKVEKETLALELIKMYYADDEFHILEKNQILNLRSIL